MNYLNQFHKEVSERKMRKITQRRELPMSDYEAVAEMFRNHRMALGFADCSAGASRKERPER